jgi:hypothetical protein
MRRRYLNDQRQRGECVKKSGMNFHKLNLPACLCLRQTSPAQDREGKGQRFKAHALLQFIQPLNQSVVGDQREDPRGHWRLL